jgi:small subunit ribosomal protein S20
MPILANAKKALRASKRKARINQKVRSRVKTSLKKVSVEAKPENIQQAQSAIDKAVKRNIFHKNKAARIKSKIAKKNSKAKS